MSDRVTLLWPAIGWSGRAISMIGWGNRGLDPDARVGRRLEHQPAVHLVVHHLRITSGEMAMVDITRTPACLAMKPSASPRRRR